MWNITVGELLEVVEIDMVRYDAGNTIKIYCTLYERPDLPDSPLHLTSTEEPSGNSSRTGLFLMNNCL